LLIEFDAKVNADRCEKARRASMKMNEATNNKDKESLTKKKKKK